MRTIGKETPNAPVEVRTSFLLDSVETLVKEDTADHNNDVPLPTKDYLLNEKLQVLIDCIDTLNDRLKVEVESMPAISIMRRAAGVLSKTSVITDMDTPTNSISIPVTMKSIDGANITVNANDLNVSTSHLNDSMALGDGTRLVQVTTSNELKTSDATTTSAIDALNFHVGLKDDLPALTDAADASQIALMKRLLERVTNLIDLYDEAGEDIATSPSANTMMGVTSTGIKEYLRTISNVLQVGITSSTLPTGASTLTEQQAQTGHLSSLVGKDFATQTTLDAINLKTPAVGQATSTLSSPVALSTDNMTSLIQEFTDLQAQLPVNLGAKLSTASLSIIPATDSDFASQITLSAMNLKTPVLGQALMDVSTPVVIASNQSEIPVQSHKNTGSQSYKVSLVASTPVIVTAPANTVGFVIKNQIISEGFVYFKAYDGTAPNTLDFDLAQGSGSAFIPSAKDLHIISDATANVAIFWVVA